MSAEAISTLAGAALSLLFSYVPGFADWFARLGQSIGPDGETVSDGGTQKRLVMLALLVLVTLGVFGAACFNLGGPAVCSKPGALDLVSALALAIMANQAVYMISPASGAAARRRQALPYRGSH
jgi:hypothetical protein